MSANQTTADNTHSSQPAAQHTGKLDAILNKVGGLGNIVYGTGKIIHGHVPGAGDPAQGGKAAIITAGRQAVERGLDRIEGKPTDTSAASHAPARDSEQGGVGDSTGSAPYTAPQASTTTPHADPNSQKAPGATADIKHPVDWGAAATAIAGTGATGTRGHGPALEQRHDERTQPATTTAPPHDRPIAANGPGVQSDTDIRQQGNGTVAGDQDKLDLDDETADTVTASESPSDRPTAADDPGAQRDTDVRQQVQGNGLATGTSVHDSQTRITADASLADSANAAGAGPGEHDLPDASGNLDVQGDTDVHQQGNGTVAGDQDKLDKETSDTASPSDLPTAADDTGAQLDTNVRQQVQESGPATGTSVHDGQTRIADGSDPADAPAGGHDRPGSSDSLDVQGDTDVCQQGNDTASPSDRPTASDDLSAQLDTNFRQQVQENPADAAGGHDRPSASDSLDVLGDTDVRQQGNDTASPSDRPTASDDLGAQLDTNVGQQVQESELATGTSVHDGQTHIADASDPADAADRPGTSDSLDVQGDTDVRQQGNGTVAVSGDQPEDKLDKETADTASPSDRPTASDDLGAQLDTNVGQQVQESEPATGTSVHDEQTHIADASDPADAAGGHDRPSASDSLDVLGDTDVRQQGNDTTSPSDRPTASDDLGAQLDTNVGQQVQESEPATGTSVHDEQTHIADASDPADAAGGHDRPSASDSLDVLGDTDVRQQGNDTASDDLSAQLDTNFRQQVQESGPATGTSVRDEQTHIADASDPADAAGGHDRPGSSDSLDVQGDTNVRQQGNDTASPSDRPTASDDLSAQLNTNYRQQVQESGPATGTSVRDEQTHIADASDPTDTAGGHDRPGSSDSLDVQGDTDVHQQGNDTTSPSDRPTAADDTGAQRDTDVGQQVQESEPATGTSVHDGQTHIADASDPADAAGGHDRPGASDSLDVQGDTDVRQQGNWTVAGDQPEDKLDKETANTASPSDRPTAADDLGAQLDTNVGQQVQESEPATGTSVHDEQTHIADASDPADAAGGHDRPSASDSLDVLGDTDVHQQGNDTASPSDRPTASDDLGAQLDTNVGQQVQESEPATGTSVHDEQTHIADASDPADTAGGHDRPGASDSLDVQGDTDVHQQGNDTASPSDRPTAADDTGAQRDTDVRQQVKENGPATGTSVHDHRQTRITADASDSSPANAAAGQEWPQASGTAPQV
ncbi:hypothetical protein F5888DRAFT_396379 [Russula emetica]|nr:hypothetical protein F5888DRAFT_396379 [Russula emetica]